MISKLENTQQLKIIQDLNEAIQKKTKVNLLGYRSSNSSNIEDRIVEPFEFMGDYEGIWCYEIKSQQVKQFKISRIEKVEILNENWQHQSEHKIPFTDAFKMSAKKPVAIVELQLSLKAYNLLREEFPLAVKDISERENLYHLKTSIANFHGIGRFVMGLSDEIKIISPETFKTFIKEKFKSLNKPFRRASVLDEFADEIFELQKEKYSFTQISEYLKFAHNVEVSKQRISTFIKSRKNDIHSKEDIKLVKDDNSQDANKKVEIDGKTNQKKLEEYFKLFDRNK